MAVFEPGTRTFFKDTNAPTGWTKDISTYNEYTLRVVNSATTSSGGSLDFTSVFTSRTISGTAPFSSLNSGSTTLNPTNLPAHAHSAPAGGGSPTNYIYYSKMNNPAYQSPAGSTPSLAYSGAAGTSGGHSHPFGTIGVSINGTLNLSVQYVDIILATKN
jgi:hypothetical protein